MSDMAIDRRFFLKVLGAAGFMINFPRSTLARFLDNFPIRTVEKKDFRFDPETGIVLNWNDHGDMPYQLMIDGLVEEPIKLSYKDLKTLRQIEQISDFHCVEGWSVPDIRWGGFRFEEILKRVKTKPGARFVLFHSLGETYSKPSGQKHYVESFPLKELLDPKREILLALEMDGRPMPHDHGSPLRVMAPYDLGYKNIKFVTRIEFTKTERPGWWTLANPIYSIKARVPNSRLRKSH